MRLGLTGGIGSGKSTVARLLVGPGAALIDADAISRATTAKGGVAIAQISAQFGTNAITPDGAMDREAMRKLIFTNPTARLQLEKIIHPLVSSECARLAEQAWLSGSALLVFDIPLLVESGGWRQQLGRVLVVDCDEATQVSRVMSRSQWSAEEVEKVMSQQATRGQRLAAADVVIYNQGLTLSELASKTKQLVQYLTL